MELDPSSATPSLTALWLWVGVSQETCGVTPVLVLFVNGDTHSGVFPKSSLVSVLEDALRGAHAARSPVKMGAVVRHQTQLQAENARGCWLLPEARRQAGNLSPSQLRGSQPRAVREHSDIGLTHPVSCGLCACVTIMWMAASAFWPRKGKAAPAELRFPFLLL